MKIRFVTMSGYSIGVRVTTKSAIGDALWDDDVNAAIYDQEWPHGRPTQWFGPGIDVDHSGGIIVEQNGVEHSIRDVYAQHVLIERMGLAYDGDLDQAKEDFLVETKIGLSDVAEEDDCIIIFREDQSFSAALQAELDIPEGTSLILESFVGSLSPMTTSACRISSFTREMVWRVRGSSATSPMVE